MGSTREFSRKIWDLIGANGVLRCASKCLMGSVRFELSTLPIIVLIPKIKAPKNVSDFRPIKAYYVNVIYKIITKSLANRLKAFLPSIISDEQSAFVPWRLITDNIIVAFETLHAIRRKTGGKNGLI